MRQRSAETGVNPKDLVGSYKIPLSIVPYPAVAAMALALWDGGGKYGPFNYREVPVQSHIYYDAMLGHAMAASNGEDHTHDSGLLHLAHVMACAAILIDGMITERIKETRWSVGKPGQSSFSRDPFKYLSDPDKLRAIISRPMAPTIGSLTTVKKEK